jgi:hypothetical protein
MVEWIFEMLVMDNKNNGTKNLVRIATVKATGSQYELLAAIKEAATTVAARISCDEDYTDAKSALISAIEIAESAGCDKDAIREAKHDVDPSYWVCG